jgi:hypothetical protein
MTVDLSQFHTVFLIVLPAFVGIVAGLIRQDKFPKWANELILLALILIVALIQALLDGKLGASPIADFMIIGTYCAAAIHLTPISNLMNVVQSTTSVGGHVDAPSSSSLLNLSDLQQIGTLLAPMLAQELVKLRLVGSTPVQQQNTPQSPFPAQPNTFASQSIGVATPNPAVSQPQIYGMNSGVPVQPQQPGDQSVLYNLATQQVQAVPQNWQQVPQQVPQSRQGG